MLPRAVRYARQAFANGGLIKSTVPGRTDRIPMKVQGGSYVLPADVVSGLGQNNTMAGAETLTKMFGMQPYSNEKSPHLATPKINYGKMASMSARQGTRPRMMPGTNMTTRAIRQRFARGGEIGQQPRGNMKIPPEHALMQGAMDADPRFNLQDFTRKIRPHLSPEVAPKYAEGGADDEHVDIITAGGEFLIPPEKIEEIGSGDMQFGWDTLDAFVKKVRSENVKKLSKLPGPRR